MVEMEKVYTSIQEFEKDFLSVDYQRRLIRENRINELVKYLGKNNLELDFKYLTRNMNSKDIGVLIIQISIEKLKEQRIN